MHKNSENFRLSRKQEQAILEIINPSNRTLADIAKKIGVTERTLYNWLNNSNFQDRLRTEREKILNQGLDNLGANFNLAVLTVRNLLVDEDPSIRLKASQTILDYNFKLWERDKKKQAEDPYYDYYDANPDSPSQVVSIYERLNRLKVLTKSHLEKMNEEYDKKEMEKGGGGKSEIKDP